MKLPGAVTFAALLGCVILIVLFVRARNELALADTALASLKSANAELTTRVGELEGKVIDDALLKRFESDHREVVKLRGEISALKRSLAAAEKKVAATAAGSGVAHPLVPEEPATNAYARVHSRKVNANIPVGHGLVLGGWPTEPGKQTFAMAIPDIDPSNPGVVSVRTRIFEVSDAALGKLDTTTLIHAASQQATMTPDQLLSFEHALETTPGVTVLASPKLLLISGREGRAFVGNTRPTPDGMMDFGSTVDLIPTLAADGASINLAVDAKLTLPNTPPPAQQ